MAYLTHLSDQTLQKLIDKALAVRNAERRRDQSSSDQDHSRMRSIGMSEGSVSEVGALWGAVERLSKAELGELVALMWIGRNGSDERGESFGEVLRRGLIEADSPGVVDYIVGKSPLIDYLREGRGFLLQMKD